MNKTSTNDAPSLEERVAVLEEQVAELIRQLPMSNAKLHLQKASGISRITMFAEAKR